MRLLVLFLLSLVSARFNSSSSMAKKNTSASASFCSLVLLSEEDAKNAGRFECTEHGVMNSPSF